MSSVCEKILDSPPEEIEQELDKLRAELDNEIPEKSVDKNLLVATWNIRGFGGLTEKWVVADSDSPKRNLHALRCITEIVSRFDVVALQEVKGNIKSLRHMLKALGQNWALVLTDVTKGAPGNSERMAYVFDTRRVQMSGLACELVLPEEQLTQIGEDALSKQFARTPYAVSFRAGGSPLRKPKTFILVTLHVLYGSNATQRVPELKAIAEWLSDWATSINCYDHNLIALGDFNIDRADDELYQAFTSTGLHVPEDLHKVPRTIFSVSDKPNLEKFYDQIAWFTGANNMPALSMKHIKSGYFGFTDVALSTLNLTKTQLSWRISDHYPLWTEFSLEK
ncbi:MAG: endonuclease/exonuclease/phosphatase family protein [Candidatus Bathyarchaeota archaeon]|nr:endonuclease/exonuclease/phosphatase family protein [Candidatus Bathyarchaeum sp.]